MNAKLKALQEPFADNEIEWRVGSTTKDKKKGMMLAYVTNRAIMNRLDDVLGTENWHDTYRELHKGIVCTLSIRLDVDKEWIVKEDGADVTNIEPTKGGLSDAMKRAAVKFGIGRYLYDAESVWVELNESGYPKTKPTAVTFKKNSKTAQKPEMNIADACEKLSTATTLEELKTVYTSLTPSLQKDNEVIAKKDELKNQLTV
jgi:hypothetical protein